MSSFPLPLYHHSKKKKKAFFYVHKNSHSSISPGCLPRTQEILLCEEDILFFGDQCEMWKTESLFWVFGICVVRIYRVKRVGFLGIMLLF